METIEDDVLPGREPFLSMRARTALSGIAFFTLLGFLLKASLPKARVALISLTQRSVISLGWIRPWIGLVMGLFVALVFFLVLRIAAKRRLPRNVRIFYTVVWFVYILAAVASYRGGWHVYELGFPTLLSAGVVLVLLQVLIARRYVTDLGLETHHRWMVASVFLCTMILFSIFFPWLYVLSPPLGVDKVDDLQIVAVLDRIKTSLPYKYALLRWGKAPLVSFSVMWEYPSLTITKLRLSFLQPTKEWGFIFTLPSAWHPQGKHPTKRFLVSRLHAPGHKDLGFEDTLPAAPLLSKMDSTGYGVLGDRGIEEYERRGYPTDNLVEGSLTFRAYEDSYFIGLEFWEQLTPEHIEMKDIAFSAHLSDDLRIKASYFYPQINATNEPE